ncbi:PHP domain-containing protein [Romboutsia sp. 13368]|uniref:PHP domain-containing protein n=1 Tax=Romboutsia sp. 13368 TaxID=2708053 RepID=UPI0025FA51CF|nr:PHP domain-containing protein [Romboutsia sp. 13368]
MQILADYHTHTIYSHGKGTIEENVVEAISKGIKTIGISDHGYKHLAYGIKLNDIYKMREEIDKLNDKYSNINILLGMECNILDSYGNIDINDKIIENCDYIMAGYHFASTPTSLKSMLNHYNNYMIKNEKAKDYNTNSIINAMKNNNIFIITHPGDKGDVYIEEIAKVAIDTDTRLEINSSHGFLNTNQLAKIKNLGNKFIIGSDAHIPQNVGNFDLAMNIIKESNLDLSLVENIKI